MRLPCAQQREPAPLETGHCRQPLTRTSQRQARCTSSPRRCRRVCLRQCASPDGLAPGWYAEDRRVCGRCRCAGAARSGCPSTSPPDMPGTRCGTNGHSGRHNHLRGAWASSRRCVGSADGRTASSMRPPHLLVATIASVQALTLDRAVVRLGMELPDELTRSQTRGICRTVRAVDSVKCVS